MGRIELSRQVDGRNVMQIGHCSKASSCQQVVQLRTER